MNDEAVVLDTDTLSLLARGEPRVTTRGLAYLERHGAFTITSVSVFERVRGYHAAIAESRPYAGHLERFQAFVATCRVLTLDAAAADRAGRIWAALSPRRRKALGDILIASIATVHGLALATRNRRDFVPIATLPFSKLRIEDWSRRPA